MTALTKNVRKIVESTWFKYLWNHFITVFFRFSLVGVLNTVVGVLLMYGSYFLFQVNYLVASTIGYGFGLIQSFLLHKLFTFRSKMKSTREVILFLIIFIIAYLTNIAGAYASKTFLGFEEWVSLIIGMGCYLVVNFLGNRFFTFPIKKT